MIRFEYRGNDMATEDPTDALPRGGHPENGSSYPVFGRCFRGRFQGTCECQPHIAQAQIIGITVSAGAA